MHTKSIGFVLLLIAVVVGVLGFTQSQGPAGIAANSPGADQSRASNKVHEDRPGTINGKLNAEMIPDHVAYAMLFRMVGDRQEESARKSIRDYVAQIFRCRGCGADPGTPDSVPGLDNPDIDTLIAAADEHHQRITVLDNEAAKIKGRSWPEPAPDTLAQLTKLQAENEALTAEIAGSLPARLSAAGMATLRVYIEKRIKPNIKMVPGPAPPPDSKFYSELPPSGAAPRSTNHGDH